MDDTATKRSALIRIEAVMSQLVAGHPADCVNEIMMVEIFKPILIWVMGVGTMIEIHRRRILHTVLITSILWNIQYTCYSGLGRTYSVFLFIEHEGGDGPTSIGTSASLTMDTNCGAAPAVFVLGAGDGTSGHWHSKVSVRGSKKVVEITEVVDGGNNQPMVFLISLPS